MAKIKLEIGERYLFLWPRNKPGMRMVGTVEKIDEMDLGDSIAHVRYSPTKPPHQVSLTRTRVSLPDQDDIDGLWVKKP